MSDLLAEQWGGAIGGVSITNHLLLGGVDFEIKIWQGGGSPKKWRVYQKIAQPPPPSADK